MSDKIIKVKNISGHNLHGVADGKTIDVKVDRDGTPYNKDWRRRFRDAPLDKCVEIVTTKKKDVK